MNEMNAIQLCLSHRDPIGFEFLVKKFKKEALFHAFSLTGNYEDAADACQESFYKAFLSITKLDKLDKFYPWFYVILRNSCLNIIRKRELIKKNTVNISSIEHTTESTPELYFERQENNREIWNAIDQLRPEQREIIIMKYGLKKNYNEISETLNIPRGTVMSRLYNARKTFKEIYRGNNGTK